ncbi:hypothetical protein B0H14DRAFT_2571956 [Mycena olivaceomarginata]|nr:hypothetical protein B0H14DRAFT_2571956 [Mycena olivaceomarginata]
MDVVPRAANLGQRKAFDKREIGTPKNVPATWEWSEYCSNSSSFPSNKQVKNIDERLASVDEDVREHYRAGLTHLAELNAPSGNVDKVHNEDLEALDLDDKQVELVAV